MAEKFNVVTGGQSADLKGLNYKVQELFNAAFPSLTSQALYKLEGAKDLAGTAFDKITGNSFKIPKQQEQSASLDFTGIQVLEADEDTAFTYLGTPIFQPIRFVGGEYSVLEDGKVVKRVFKDMMLPATSLAEFNRSKIIVKTQQSGDEGTVKELWGFSDWEINIRGMVLATTRTNKFPEAEFLELLAWENIVDSIEVVGGFFEFLKIKRLCIEKLNIGRVAGFPNVIPFQMPCVSDKASELIIKENRLTP